MARIEEISEEQIRKWRAQGIKSIEVGPESSQPCTRPSFKIEFFPLTAFDHAGAALSAEPDTLPEERSERDTEAPPAVNVPPAMARVLQKGSVS
jgi:hypothetical protein